VASVELPAGSLTETVAPGDTLELSIPDGLLLRAAARAYVLPVAGLIAGAAVSTAIGLSGDAAAATGAVLGGVAGHLLAKHLNRSVRRSARLRRVEPDLYRGSP
jgi:positive regulator of sigma E activity